MKNIATLIVAPAVVLATLAGCGRDEREREAEVGAPVAGEQPAVAPEDTLPRHVYFGDTHVHGVEGVRFYTRAKVVTARWPEPRLRGKKSALHSGLPQRRWCPACSLMVGVPQRPQKACRSCQ